LTLYKIRNAQPVAIAPKYNIQFKAVRRLLRLLRITYAFLANEGTGLCSQRNSHDFETRSTGFVALRNYWDCLANLWFQAEQFNLPWAWLLDLSPIVRALARSRSEFLQRVSKVKYDRVLD
jgi:hypothetical protein